MQKSIYLDATHFGMAKPTGVEVYTDALLPRLSELLRKEGVQVTWIGHASKAPAGKPQAVAWIHSPYKAQWGQRVLPKLLAKDTPDLFFTPSGISPIRSSVTTAMTVHDLAVYTFPQAFSWSQRLRLTWVSRLAARKAAVLLTPSEHTKREAEKYWDIPAARFAVTPLGYVGDRLQDEVVPGIPSEQLITFIGRIEHKKNLITLQDAFAKVTNPRAHLVLAGGDGNGAEKICLHFARFPQSIRSRIHFTGYISDAQREWLYNHSTLVVVPGVAEGFGLPVLEAFSHKVPVLCAKAGALPEIGGEAANYVEPYSVASWTKAMNGLLEDASLRTDLIAQGTERLKEYSWDTTAQLTADALLKQLIKS